LASERTIPELVITTTEQEQRARVEEAQRTPFDAVLRKLKRTTSINQLKLMCEGSTDEPIYKALLTQASDPQDIIVDNVGGWPNSGVGIPKTFCLAAKRQSSSWMETRVDT
jgi:hypothetical protein